MVAVRIFDENFAAVECRKTVLTLNRPAYVGMAILDLSKMLMYDFYYNHLKKMYEGNVELCMTDTDSFLVKVTTKDIYEDMGKFKNMFDTSNYPPNHPLFSEVIKEVPPEEYVGLKPKYTV